MGTQSGDPEGRRGKPGFPSPEEGGRQELNVAGLPSPWLFSLCPRVSQKWAHGWGNKVPHRLGFPQSLGNGGVPRWVPGLCAPPGQLSTLLGPPSGRNRGGAGACALGPEPCVSVEGRLGARESCWLKLASVCDAGEGTATALFIFPVGCVLCVVLVELQVLAAGDWAGRKSLQGLSGTAFGLLISNTDYYLLIVKNLRHAYIQALLT